MLADVLATPETVALVSPYKDGPIKQAHSKLLLWKKQFAVVLLEFAKLNARNANETACIF
jgi:hypothetical protein